MSRPGENDGFENQPWQEAAGSLWRKSCEMDNPFIQPPAKRSMKITIIVPALILSFVLAGCTTSGNTGSSRPSKEMPGMTEEEHAKMKH